METTHPKESWMSTLVVINHKRAASRKQVAPYSPGFNSIGPSYQTERKYISLTRGRDSTSRVEVSTIPSIRKTEQSCIRQVKKNKADQKILRNISSLKVNCKELEENMSASEEAD